jgi:hypothetical protein
MTKSHGDVEAGRRLEEELIKIYGSKKAAALAMGMKDGSYWTTYIKGRNKIGGILQKKLLDAGLNLDYILKGNSADAVQGFTRASELEKLRIRLKVMSSELGEMAEIIEKLSLKV